MSTRTTIRLHVYMLRVSRVSVGSSSPCAQCHWVRGRLRWNLWQTAPGTLSCDWRMQRPSGMPSSAWASQTAQKLSTSMSLLCAQHSLFKTFTERVASSVKLVVYRRPYLPRMNNLLASLLDDQRGRHRRHGMMLSHWRHCNINGW